jgi:hypothetical protein
VKSGSGDVLAIDGVTLSVEEGELFTMLAQPGMVRPSPPPDSSARRRPRESLVPSTASAALTPPMTNATRTLHSPPTQPTSGPPIGVVPAIATLQPVLAVHPRLRPMDGFSRDGLT